MNEIEKAAKLADEANKLKSDLENALKTKIGQASKAVSKGVPTKNAFEHYFGLDKKGNVNVENF